MVIHTSKLQNWSVTSSFVYLVKKELIHIADMTEHMKESMSNLFGILIYQSCANPFCLRVPSMCSKKGRILITNLDTLRISQEAKLRELAYPFPRYARAQIVTTSIDSYYNNRFIFSIDEIQRIGKRTMHKALPGFQSIKCGRSFLWPIPIITLSTT